MTARVGDRAGKIRIRLEDDTMPRNDSPAAIAIRVAALRSGSGRFAHGGSKYPLLTSKPGGYAVLALAAASVSAMSHVMVLIGARG